MNRTQCETLRFSRAGEATLHARTFSTGGQRTLVYGYTTERETFHVYLSGDEFHRVIYTGSLLISYEHAAEMSLRSLRPNKRAYPERTDFDFAAAMANAGQPLSLLPYPDAGEPKDFAGFHGSIVGADGTLIDMASRA